MTLLVYVCAIGAVTVGALVQGAAGFGLGTLDAPILGLLDDSLVPGPMLFLAVLLTAWLALGRVILVGIGLSLTRWSLRPTPSTLTGAGALSGFMGTLTSVGGPPIALVYQREEAARLRSTLSGFFFFGATLSLAALIAAGRFGRNELEDGIILVPGLVFGILIGRPARPLLDRGWTRTCVLGLSALAASALVIESWP